MDGQRQLGVGVSCFLVQVAPAEPLAGAAEADTQGEVFVSILEGAEQAADFIGAVAGRANNAQRGGGIRAALLDALKQDALELVAVFGPFGIDAAATAVERGARLGQVRGAQRRVRVADGQAKRPQPRSVVAGAQLEIGKDDAVAAQPTGGAKLPYNPVVGILCAIQTTRKLRPNVCRGNAGPFRRQEREHFGVACQGVLLQGHGALCERTTV